MRLVIKRLLIAKEIKIKMSILNTHNNQSLIQQDKQNVNRYYRFSTQNREHIIDEKKSSFSMNIMLKQLSINDKQSFFKYPLVHQQRITAIGMKIITLIQQQIRFISLNQLKVSQYLRNVNYPQNLKEELSILIKTIYNFTINKQEMNPYELDSKYSFLQYMQDYLFHKSKTENIFSRISGIIECEIKFRETLSYFKSYNYQQNIINTHPNKYPQTWQNIYVLNYSDKDTMSKGYTILSNIFTIISAAIMMKQQIDERSLGFLLYFRFLKQNQRNIYSLLFFKNFKIENGKRLFNFFQQKPFQKIVELSYDAIKTNKFIYIPADGNFEGHVQLFKQSKNTIPVRVLYYKQLPLIKQHQNQNHTDYIKDIVVHMHGGGFVTLSSHTTQNYTRKWANEIKIPIFSIDYRMAPDHAFPQAPNDCFQVYKFLTAQLYKYMKIKPVNILVGGDSAGANLSCAITTLALKNSLLIPKSLYLAYPPVNMDFIYYPSRKYILNDPSLWPTMIKAFMNCYLQNQDDVKNPLASPIFLTEEFIGGKQGDKKFPIKWPKTYIAVGMKDPLRDQCLLFMKRMADSNVDCKCFIYEHMSHGFLSTDQIIKDTSKTITHSIELLKELIDTSKNNRK